MSTPSYVDLFAGPGGWDVAASRLGWEGVGIEKDKHACATRRAAGLDTIEGDVRDHRATDHPADGLIASPPCQTFSQAGPGAGRRVLATVVELARSLAAREDTPRSGFEDERTGLVLEPLRWVLDALDHGTPYRWVALEQVPTVRPVWEEYARLLEAEGYTAHTALLSAECYGVPQTRRRAILVAHLGGPVDLPPATHSRYFPADPGKQELGVEPWVSMAEALGWEGRPGTEEYATSATRERLEDVEPDAVHLETQSHGHGSGERNVRRTLVLPAPTVAMGHGAAQWKWRVNNQTGTPVDLSWPFRRPSTTVSTRSLVQHPGSVANRHQPGVTQSRNDGIRLLPEEAAALQTFPPGYPFAGPTTHVFRQIGNAIPSLFAQAVLAAATNTNTEEQAA